MRIPWLLSYISGHVAECRANPDAGGGHSASEVFARAKIGLDKQARIAAKWFHVEAIDREDVCNSCLIDEDCA